MGHLMRGSILYSLTSIVPQAIGFLLLPVYTRVLTPGDYGVLALASVLGTLLGLLMTLQLPGSVMRFHIEYQGEERRAFLGTVWLFVLASALVQSILALLLAPPLLALAGVPLPLRPHLLLVVGGAFLGSLAQVPLVLLRAEEKARWVVALSLAATGLSIGLTLFFLLVRHEGVVGVLKANALTAGIMAAGFYVPFALRRVRLAFSPAFFREARAYAFPLIPHALAGYVFLYSDRLILAAFVPIAAVGIYSLADTLAQGMKLAVNSFNDASVPYFMRLSKTRADAKEVYREVMAGWTVLAVLGALVLSLFAREILLLMAAPAYHPAYSLVPLLVAAYFLRGIYLFPVNGLMYAKATRAVPAITWTAALVNVALNVLLIPLLGIWGAALATLAAFAVTVVLALRIGAKHHPLLYDWPRMGKTVGAGLACGLAAWLLAPPDLLGGALVKTAAVIGFIVLMPVLGCIDAAPLKRAWRGRKGEDAPLPPTIEEGSP